MPYALPAGRLRLRPYKQEPSRLSRKLMPMPNAQCPMPNAQCPSNA
ncbi:MAG: hypothetical protein F6J93_39175 [Oscillatoria sp. SIO1A7]|nr:hypothetical protein [Oscillatoria sp. SIO1A7]